LSAASARLQTAVYIATLAVFGLSAVFAYPLVHPERVLFREAEQARSAGELQTALALYQQALDAGLSRGSALRQVAMSAAEAGAFGLAEEAIDRHEVQTLRPPPTVFDLMELAGALDQAGQVQLASDLLLRHGAQFASPGRHALYAADLHRRAERFDVAERIYQRLRAQSSPELARLASQRQAEMLAWQGRYRESEALLRELLAARGEDRTARILLGRVLSWSGRTEEAIREYEQALGPAK
jgi:tetratricopeptide (TPR) repeat protein